MEYTGIAQSKVMQKLLAKVAKIAKVPRPILIRGERGTGKELMANYLHRASSRADEKFVTINCAAFTEKLIASEMFGHEKGAFTGANEQRIGRMEQANKGSLFMDEVGIMPMNFQEQILRAVEYQTFERVGSSKPIKVDVRLISATNANLEELMEEKLFRRDLYDRLTFAEIELPSLRQRKDDIPALIVHFVKLLHEEMPSLQERKFRSSTVEVLMDYYWPGNIRELKNIVERLYLFGDTPYIEEQELPAIISGADYIGLSFDDRVENFKRKLILKAYEDCGGNQSEAARQLQMTYSQFRHFYQKYCP
ncbi:response regulator of hydrogenase 3 activity (sensor HydH) [Lentisphaera araneosa HTCC2155]|uniref:Response regulator of hydrogenase 3 activity (Sensor HydH) n=1 Tax=Lentisphaera araneosa HTCC2155 TaxID=313628 RepID=A6DPB0_9BACT|nr:sigma-54 dependent transcriptional regulator [Lentisphaera araneosa]EDM26642.1 response regulator of hydrogenase 3 activity (sensor HydH) [Lentisphaera araneosa HTCC2155]